MWRFRQHREMMNVFEDVIWKGKVQGIKPFREDK